MTNNILPAPVEAAEIEKYLPHRYPFLLLDRVISMVTEPEKKLIGIKNVSKNEPYFQGHFPGNPVMPGVLIIESMAQLVRAGTFFIPASIGAQEGIFVVTIQLLTGSMELGLAAALVRRVRELAWVAPALLLAWRWSVISPCSLQPHSRSGACCSSTTRLDASRSSIP